MGEQFLLKNKMLQTDRKYLKDLYENELKKT